MNKQELIVYCNDLKESKSRFINCIDVDRIIETIKQLDEPKPVKVPQFVADWITHSKNIGRSLFGYEVEEEKRYEVILCNGQSLKTVYRQGGDHLDFEMVYGDLESFTRKRLEEAGFGWVFDCPGIEIEEVEE